MSLGVRRLNQPNLRNFHWGAARIRHPPLFAFVDDVQQLRRHPTQGAHYGSQGVEVQVTRIVRAATHPRGCRLNRHLAISLDLRVWIVQLLAASLLAHHTQSGLEYGKLQNHSSHETVNLVRDVQDSDLRDELLHLAQSSVFLSTITPPNHHSEACCSCIDP